MSKQSRRGPAWDKVRGPILERDGVCQLQYGGCTYDTDLTIDHIVPVSLGGSDDEWNLQAACRTCNGKKSNNMQTRNYWIDEEWFNA